MNTLDIQQWLTQHLAGHFDLPAADIDPTATLLTYGIDSAYALVLSADIHDTFDVLVGPTIAWDHPTIAALARHIADQAGT